MAFTFLLRFGFIADKISALILTIIERFHGLLAAGTGRHLDKGKSFRISRTQPPMDGID